MNQGYIDMNRWTGNITLKMDEKEDTYASGSTEVERYGDNAIAFKVTAGEGRARAATRFTRRDCKALINELIESL